jgi:hypothetical protein
MQRVNSLIYAAPIVPAIIISSIYGTARLQVWLSALSQKLSSYPNLHAKRPITTRSVQLLITPLLTLILLFATLLYHARYGYLPGGGQFRGWEEISEHHRRAERIFAQIPAEAALSAQDRLNPHVSQRETLYIFDRVEQADHIVLDVTEDSWPLHPLALRHRVDEFLAGGFGIVDAYDGYLLLAKNRPDLPTTLPAEFYDFARVSNPQNFSPRYPTNVVFANKLRLVGYDLSLGAHEAFLPVVTLYWQALEPLEQDYMLWPFFINRNGHLIEDTSQRPLVTTLWYPPARWSPTEVIITRTLPWDLGDEFTLAVGVTKQTWADPGQRLSLSEVEPDLYTFEDNTWVRLGTFRQSGPKTYQHLSPTPLPAPQPPQAQFWHLIELQQADLLATSITAGQPVPFTLQWQTEAPLTLDLTTFAHLLNEEGQAVAQLDWTPQDSLGYLPTTAWQPQHPIIDHQILPLPTDLAPGKYRLVVGWYYPVTGDRLPLTLGEGTDTTQVGVLTIH